MQNTVGEEGRSEKRNEVGEKNVWVMRLTHSPAMSILEGRPGGDESDTMAGERTETVKAEVEDRNSAYFQYYALLSHQAQMLEDAVRTSTYQRAILAHSQQCFQDKIVMDVGAGNGILSIFAAQAGAKKVYAVEASNMVERLQHFVDASSSSNKEPRNPWLAGRLLPISSKMEDVTAKTIEGTEQVDTVISECLGVVSRWKAEAQVRC